MSRKGNKLGRVVAWLEREVGKASDAILDMDLRKATEETAHEITAYSARELALREALAVVREIQAEPVTRGR